MGKTRDDSTGLTQLGARYFDELTGRFVSVDPVLQPEVAAQFNAYVYSGNNPVTWADPTGLFWGGIRSAWNAASSFVGRHQATIVGAVVGAAAFTGCMAATMGAGSVGCGVAAGAAGGAVSNLWRTKVQKAAPFSWGGLAKETAFGAAGGLAGAGVGAVASKAVPAAASKVGAALSNVTKRAAPKSAGAAKAGAAPKVAGPARAGASGKAAPTAARACSFTGATLVLMGDGSKKPIEDVEVGEQVVASDPQTGEQEVRTVTHVFVHKDTVVDLALDNGTVLGTTEDHPFWSVTDGRFERADELDAGEHVLAADGRVLTVAGLRGDTSRTALAYNLSVDGIHTYHVGADAVLVHNMCDVPDGPSPASPSFIGFTNGPPAIVPKGATGPLPTRGPGIQFTGGSGGPGLHSNVSGVRVMDQTMRHQRRVVYMNKPGQTISPITGQTISNSHPLAHIPW